MNRLVRAAGATLVASLLIAGPANAHLGPGQNPPLEISVTLEKMKLIAMHSGPRTQLFGEGAFGDGFMSPGDGLDGNAEFQVLSFVTHTTHGVGTSETTNTGLRHSIWTPDQEIYNHVECSPHDAMTVAGQVIEIDQSGLSSLGTNVAGAGAGLIIANFPGAVVGFLISQVASMNGNDIWGSFGGAISPGGEVVMPFGSEEGDGELTFSATQLPLPADDECGGATQVGFFIPSEATERIFEPLGPALASAFALSAEEGVEISSVDQDAIQASAVAMVVGIGRLAAAHMVNTARGYDGGDAAVELFLLGDELALEGVYDDAIASYRDAFETARAAFGGFFTAEPSSLPLSLVVSPETFATVAGRSVTLVAAVVGEQGPAELFVADAPEGVAVRIVDNGVELAFDEALAPGVYNLELAATDGESETSTTVELLVGQPRPEPEIIELPDDTPVDDVPEPPAETVGCAAAGGSPTLMLLALCLLLLRRSRRGS